MKYMVVGSGGREHAISWMLAKSAVVDEILCVPGNGGTAAESKCCNCRPEDCDYTEGLTGNDAIAQVAAFEQVDAVVVGPEDPLAAGLADQLWGCGIAVVGPKKQGAALEASKGFAKDFMRTHGVASAKSAAFSEARQAIDYIVEMGAPVVVKADGLAAGKGVVVAATVEQATAAVSDFMTKKTLGEAGNQVIIEEYLQGVEVSILAAVSVTEKFAQLGKATIVPFVTARDHKRLLDGAKGPNTGGMGAIAPVADFSADDWKAFDTDILQPTLRGMIAEKMDYRGFIFFGLMMTQQGPKLLEYNVRLGDPETQAVLPLMQSDFASLCQAIIDGSLKDFKLEWKEGFVCAPVAVSGGYPGSYAKGKPITIDRTAVEKTGAKIFIAGASQASDGTLVTSGGRVLASSAYAQTFEQARTSAYDALKTVSFSEMFYRKDIGLPGAAESGEL